MRAAPVRQFAWIAFGVIITLLGGCDSAKEAAVSSGPPPEWALNLTLDSAPLKIPLEVMDVNLVEDDAYAEFFEITGTGVTLVGEFPLNVHVDYGEHWDRLKGQTIIIQSTMDHPAVSPASTIQLPDGTVAEVLGGNFTVQTISGTYAGSDGDITVSGTINLDVNTPGGMKSMSGTFAVHAVTWG